MINSHKEYVNLHTVPIPRPGPTQVLVKIHAGGCCHTDVHAIDGDWPVPSKLPLILGHEGMNIQSFESNINGVGTKIM